MKLIILLLVLVGQNSLVCLDCLVDTRKDSSADPDFPYGYYYGINPKTGRPAKMPKPDPKKWEKNS